jgi:hypothetical protein
MSVQPKDRYTHPDNQERFSSGAARLPAFVKQGEGR